MPEKVNNVLETVFKNRKSTGVGVLMLLMGGSDAASPEFIEQMSQLIETQRGTLLFLALGVYFLFTRDAK